MLKTLISVSTHPAKNQINNYVRDFENAKVDMFHCDVMDGNFVQDTAFSIDLLKQLKQTTTLPLDVHLMVKDAYKQAEEYCKNGANIVTVHAESFNDISQLKTCIQNIKSYKVLAGVSIKPTTVTERIKSILNLVDLVLVMSVEPGASGQKFNPQAIEKIKQLNQIKQDNNYNFLIEVDGGINNTNSQEVINAGANILVSGSYIYNSNNYANAVQELKGNN